MNISRKVDVLVILKVGFVVLAGILLFVLSVKSVNFTAHQGQETIVIQFLKNDKVEGEVEHDLVEETETVLH